MVEAIGFVTGLGTASLSAFGIALTTASGALTFAGMALNLAGSLVLNAILAPSMPDAPRPDNIQVNTKNAVAARVGHYGFVKSGGNAVFDRAKEGISYTIFTHGHGEVAEIVQYYLNNEPVTLGADGYVTDEQYQYKRPRVQILNRLGVVPEAHYNELTAAFPEWTPDHRLDGLCTSLVILESCPPQQHREMYPRGEPSVSALLRSKKCFDPRSGNTEFTENAALIIADYIASDDGFARPDAFDKDNLIRQADICGKQMPLASGGTEAQFRISGSYLLTERPQDVLQRMLLACAGRIRLLPSGKLALQVGAWKEPEFTIRYEDILEIPNVDAGPDLLDSYNHLPARYSSHRHGHVEVDADPWVDLERQARDGTVLVGPAKQILMSPSHRQTRAVMKLLTEQENPLLQIQINCKPKCLPAYFEDTVIIDALGIKGVFEIVTKSLVTQGGNLQYIALKLNEIRSGAFDLAVSEQGKEQPIPAATEGAGVPVPQNVTAAAAGIKITQESYSAGIAVRWDAAPRDSLTPLVKIKEAGTTDIDWLIHPVSGGTSSAKIGNLTDGGEYDMSVSFVSVGGAQGAEVIIAGVIAQAVTGAPAAPTALVVLDTGSSSARITLATSVSDGLWKTEIFRDGVAVFTSREPASTAIDFIDHCGGGTFEWTAISTNVSGTSSSIAGPYTKTIVS